MAEACPLLDLVLLPKAGGARDIEFVGTPLSGIERAIGRSNPIGIEALVDLAHLKMTRNIHERDRAIKAHAAAAGKQAP